MKNNFKMPSKVKSPGEYLRSRYFWKSFLGALIGGIIGFLYFYFIGCRTGSCAITSHAGSALWCSPCKMQSPILKEVATELGDRVKVIKIDVDHNSEIANRYNIQGVPTLMIFKNGEIKYKQAGVHTKSQLMNVLINNL